MPGPTCPEGGDPMAAMHALIIYFDRVRPLLVLLVLWGWLRHNNK
jgi:hypothetical protein